MKEAIEKTLHGILPVYPSEKRGDKYFEERAKNISEAAAAIAEIVKRELSIMEQGLDEKEKELAINRRALANALAMLDELEARLAEVRQHLVGALDNIPQPGPNAVLWLIRARQELEKACCGRGRAYNAHPQD